MEDAFSYYIRAFAAPSTDPVPREGPQFFARHLMWQKAGRDSLC